MADAQPSRVELKPIVLKAINNARWDIRAKAFSALSKVSKNKSEENQLIGKVGDSDGDVRNTIMKIPTKKQIKDSYVAVLSQKYQSQNWEVRRDVAKLLGKIKSSESRDALEDQLTKENDGDVKNKIIASIKAIKN